MRKRFTSVGGAHACWNCGTCRRRSRSACRRWRSARCDIVEQIRQGYLKDNIRVRVEKKVNPGVVIKVGSELVRIQEEMAGPKVFAYKLGRIKVF